MAERKTTEDGKYTVEVEYRSRTEGAVERLVVRDAQTGKELTSHTPNLNDPNYLNALKEEYVNGKRVP